MRVYYLFELFLALFGLYAVLYDVEIQVLVPILCLIIVYLFEVFQAKRLQKPKK
jgi:hypothetical protein